MRLAIVVKCDWSVGEILKKHVFKKLPGSSDFLLVSNFSDTIKGLSISGLVSKK